MLVRFAEDIGPNARVDKKRPIRAEYAKWGLTEGLTFETEGYTKMYHSHNLGGLFVGRRKSNIIKGDFQQLDFFELTDHVTLKTKPYWIPQYVEDANGRVTTGYAEIISSRVSRRQPRPLDTPIPRRMDMITFPVPKGKKWCAVCGDWVGKRNFSPKADAFDGLHPYCKMCRAEAERKRYWAAKESAQLIAAA